MQIPKEVRYDYVYRTAAEFIVAQNITQLPVEPFQIIAANQWSIVTYKQLSQRSGVAVADLMDILESPDGSTSCNKNKKYCIAYNNQQRVYPRIKFTLFHEMGHIILKHFIEYDIYHLTDEQKAILEDEANFFASNVMAPSIVIEKCRLIKPQILSCACGMSRQAAKNRLRQFKSWTFCEWDELVQDMMQEYISLMKPSRINPISVEVLYEESAT